MRSKLQSFKATSNATSLVAAFASVVGATAKENVGNCSGHAGAHHTVLIEANPAAADAFGELFPPKADEEHGVFRTPG